MGFSTDYTDVKEDTGGLIPKGEYEVIIKCSGEDVSMGGSMYINTTCVIRNDVEGQKYGNKYLWLEIWQRKEPDAADLACGGYSAKQINALSKAAGLPNNNKYESLAEWGEALEHRCIRVKVEHETYNGKERVKTKFPVMTRFPECRHEWDKPKAQMSDYAAPAAGYSDYAEIKEDDGDLPF